MAMKTFDFVIAWFLVVYLFATGFGAGTAVVVNFPTEKLEKGNKTIVFPRRENGGPYLIPFGRVASDDQGIVAIALLAGIAGSFLHAAQSLITYIGNRAFDRSWTAWYILRPWIGGILGLAIYFALRAGIVAGANGVNPYGVVAIGLLGGWFSKTTTDKLQEVFATLFTSDADKNRKNKLTDTSAAND